MRSAVAVTINDRDLQRKLAQALIMLGPQGSLGLMRALGQYMRRSTMDKFKAQGDGDRDWEPLADSTVEGRRDVRAAKRALGKRKTQKGRDRQVARLNAAAGSLRILDDTGTLRRSVDYVADSSSVEIGTDLYYGIFHQLGAPAKGLPDRPFITVSREDEQRIGGLADRYLQRVFR